MVKPRAPEAMTLSSSHFYFSLHGCSLSSMRVLFLGLIILVNNSSNYNASVHAAFVVNTRSSSSISGSMKPSVTAASLAPRSPTTISRRCIASTNAVGPLRTLSYRLHHHHHEGRHQHPNPFRTRNCSRFSRKYGCASIQTPIPTATRRTSQTRRLPGLTSTPRMSVYVGDLEVTISEHVSYAAANLHVEASRIVDTDTGKRRTWYTRRSEDDFARLGLTLRGALGHDRVPAPPPPSSSPAVLEGYLRRLLELPGATNAVYQFLFVEDDTGQEPVLQGEVVSGDFPLDQRFRSADPDSQRTASGGKGGGGAGGRPRTAGDKAGAAVAGAVVGGLVAGPLGAAIGAVAGRAAVKRDDGVGDVAKGAARVADAAIDTAQNIEKDLEIKRKATRAARSAAAAVKKMDSDLKVRERAKVAAKEAVARAKRVDQEHKLRERASGAAQRASEAAKRAAEVAKTVDKDYRVRERAGNAFRRVKSRIQKSVEDMQREEEEKPEDDR